MNFTLGEILHWLTIYKYWVLFPIAVFEGPIITVIAGFLVSLGLMNIYAAFVIVVLGDFVGDLLYYAIGMLAKVPTVSKYIHYIGITQQRVARLEAHFEKHPGKTLLFGKFSHVFGAATLVSAGMARMNISKFLFFTTLGTIPKSIILLFIGYFFGHSYMKINTYIDYGSYIIFAATLVLIGIYYLFVKYSKNFL